MRNFTLSLLFTAAILFAGKQSDAQCPTPGGMVATALQLNGNCYMFVQFAIANSNVSIYNASGYVAQGNASAQGQVLIPFPCAAAPITAVLSIDPLTGTFCNVANISNPITLPVKITAFNAQFTAQGVVLKWTSSYELNNSKYVIEKSSDGIQYSSVGEIAGSENSFSDKNYEFTDASFHAGDAAFYRLKQIDLDGKATYTKVVYVNNGKSGSQPVKIFPNPFVNEIQVTGISSAELTNKNIKLYSSTGTQVSFQVSGSNAIMVDPSLPSGLYILKVKGNAYKIMKN
jgi:hypothetical protein